MKIVFTVATYYPNTDGVQQVTQYQAEGLAKKGHEVKVITSKINGIANHEIYNGVEIIRVDAYNFYYWHKGNKKQYQRLIINETKEADAIVAVCLQSFSADWLLNILSKIKCKKILYMHGMSDFKLHISDFRSLKNVLKTIFRNIRWKIFYTINLNKMKKFDAIIHLFKNDNSYNFFSKHEYKNNYVIENSCEKMFFNADIIENNKKYFIYVGNYCERKNQELAMKAYYKIKNRNIELICIGSKRNSYCQKLEKLRNNFNKKYGHREVKILYGLSRKEILEYVKKSYACIMTSSYEYYPITIIESLAVGKPFISTNVGIVRLLPGGIIADNESDLTYWMDFFVNNKEYTVSLGNLGKEFVRSNLNVEKKVEELEDIILNG